MIRNAKEIVKIAVAEFFCFLHERFMVCQRYLSTVLFHDYVLLCIVKIVEDFKGLAGFL